MMVENYPVGWALDTGKPEPVLAYLIDVPGIAMQGRTMSEALRKLQAIAPTVLATYQREGIGLPKPSPEPSLRIGRVKWTTTTPPPSFPRDSSAVDVDAIEMSLV